MRISKILAAASLLAGPFAPTLLAAPAIDPSALPKIGSVSERYQSYNIEMLEITGGRFWKPYADKSAAAGGERADPYAYRPPIDLTQPLRRRLAAALGPVYVRVSGTWANTTYLAPDDAPVDPVPAGYGGVLTRAAWKNVLEFAKAVDGALVTSFAIGAGTRDASGAWQPAEAEAFVDYTQSIGGTIAATEFMNEPDIAAFGGAPKGYSAEAYVQDYRRFQKFARAKLPSTLLLAPGSATQSAPLPTGAGPVKFHTLPTVEAFAAAPDLTLDAYIYHFYPAVSRRMATLAPTLQVTAEGALSEEFLSRPDQARAFYAGWRDRTKPGKPLWVTETAEAAGGRQSVGGEFSRFLSLSRSARPIGAPGRPGGDAQYARCERLWPARREHPAPAAELLGGAAVARFDGHDGSRLRRSDPRGLARLRSRVESRSRWHRGPGDRHEPDAAAVDRFSTGQRPLHPGSHGGRRTRSERRA
jgi:hypothetical protein